MPGDASRGVSKSSRPLFAFVSLDSGKPIAVDSTNRALNVRMYEYALRRGMPPLARDLSLIRWALTRLIQSI
jgi:hypothetical protein